MEDNLTFTHRSGHEKKERAETESMMPESEYIEVAVARPVSHTFTYAVPSHLRSQATLGKRVLVPFGNFEATGYILDYLDTTDQQGLKTISDVLDDVPLFPSSMIPFFRWIASYYLCPIGQVIKEALPGGLNITHVTTIGITEMGRSALADSSLKRPDRTLLRALESDGAMRLSALGKSVQRTIPPASLRALERKGWITRERRLKPGRVRPKKEKYVRSLPDRPSPDGLSKARQRILTAVEAEGEASLKALKAVAPSASSLVKKMAADGFVEFLERDVYRDPFGEPIPADPALPSLTAEQASVLATLLDAFGTGFQTYLLYGITGSGKTEVYMRAVAAALDRDEQALVLVPEIALISQTERLFRARFGDCIALLHSGLNQGERFDQWMRIIRHEAKVAIGARSAIFAPFDRLGLIVVDEEHDDSYKSASGGLRYHARDLAVVRAKLDGAVALLGSATPSVQSFHNVQTKKFRGCNLRKRIEDWVLPEVTVVDLRETEGARRSKPFITEELRLAMEETLDRREQVLLFLNRRGFANCPTCTRCGEPIRCKNCDVTMTLHQGASIFKCHYCGYSCLSDRGCPACGSPRIKPLGLGTERIEEEVKRLFPEATVARMDRDTTARKGALVRMLKDLRDGSLDILLGTQMVAKGHHYPKITLVGIICADLSLNFPDFRAGERTFQLLAQVAGRAGRGTRQGRVILQTFNPDHFCILTAKDQDYRAFYEREIDFRKGLLYPPYSRLVQILVTGQDKKETARYAHDVGRLCRDLRSDHEVFKKGVHLLGPVAAPLGRIKGQYRWQVLLKGLETGPLHDLARTLKGKMERDLRRAGVRAVLDVDPMDML